MKNYLQMHRKHVERCQQGAAKTRAGSKKPASGEPETDREYAIWRQMAESDNSHLKSQFPDHKERNKQKPALLEKYRAYLDTWLADENQTQVQNDVLVRNAIWAADCGQYTWAIMLADAGKQMATGFQRDLPTFVADTILQESDDDAFVELILNRIENGEWELNHPLMAKYYRHFALVNQKDNPRLALHYSCTALEAYPEARVKTLIKELQTTIKKL